MMVSRELVWLGYAVALHLEDDEDHQQIKKFAAHHVGLFSNHDGTAIYLLPLTGKREIEIPKGRPRGKKLWQNWSQFEVDDAFLLTVTKAKSTLYKCGYCTAIIYDSDKWSGNFQKYIHEFNKRLPAYCNRSKKPSVFGVLSIDGKKIVTARGLIG